MKTTIYILALILLLTACNGTAENGMTLSILEDTTETDFLAQPSAEGILPKFGFEDDLWHAATFRYGTINSMTHNGRISLSIGAENNLLGNELERRKQVADFKKEVKAILEVPKDSMGYDRSSIWLPLVGELEQLQDHNEQVIIYLFSDLRENTTWFSTYGASDTARLKNDPDVVIGLFMDRASSIKTTNRMEVVVVYQPQTVEEDAMFQQMRKLYEKLFQCLDIPICFVANLDHRPL